MKTKVILKIVMLLTVCLITFVGCSGKQYTASDFVGEWESEDEISFETVEFSADGTFSKVLTADDIGEVARSGKYSVENGKVAMSFDQTGVTNEYYFKFKDEKTMVWTDTEVESCEIIYTKK